MKTSSGKIGVISWLFNPFAYVAGGRSLTFGLGAILVAGFIASLSRSHFDGVLDLHSGRPAPLWIFLSEGLIDWLLLGIVLLILGKTISKTRFRVLDLLGTQAMARWPTVFTALAAWPDAVQCVSAYRINFIRGAAVTARPTPAEMVVFYASILAIVLATCWFVVLSYRAFSISCNVKGGKAAAAFIAGILIAEVLSKLLIVFLLNNFAGA